MDFYTMSVLMLLAAFSMNVLGAKHHNKHKQTHNKNMFCFSDKDIRKMPSHVLDNYIAHKMHWEKYTAVSLVPSLEDIERRRKRKKRNPQSTCAQFNMLEKTDAVNDRSISPWSYRIDTDENRYPQKLAFAHCLCQFCINADTGKQTTNLNSALIKQKMPVLRKKTCPHDSSQWTFDLEYETVPVGCTCVLPKS